jgi:hypothetical protein
MKNPIMLRISKWSISTMNFHGSFENFANPPIPTTHLMVSSLKEIKGKKLDS